MDHRKDAVAVTIDGKPMWAPSRRNSAEDGAQRAFERNGEAFGADNVDQFVRKAHAFVGHPPKGTETLVRRNGDTLFYDPKANVFAWPTRTARRGPCSSRTTARPTGRSRRTASAGARRRRGARALVRGDDEPRRFILRTGR